MADSNSKSYAQQFISTATEYRDRGFGIVWLLPGERFPKRTGWTTKSQEPTEYIPGYNLGIMTGWISGGLVCVDLDIELAISAAPRTLPATKMIDGRSKKPSSHWWYKVTDIPEHLSSSAKQATEAAARLGVHPGPKTFHFLVKDSGATKEALALLGTGSLGSAPPSIVGEETRVWYANGEPTCIPYQELYDATCELAEICGWRPPSIKDVEAIQDLKKVKAVSGKGGRSQTWRAAKLLINDYLYSVTEALTMLREWNEEQDPPWTDAELYEALERAKDSPADERFPAGAKLLPRIQASQLNLAQTLDAAIEALKDNPSAFRRGGELVHIVEKDDKTPRIRKAPETVVQELLATSAQWIKYDADKKRDKQIPVPGWVVEGVYNRGSWPCIRYLKNIVEMPVLRPDGSILSEPGYDADTNLLYIPQHPPLHIATEPSLYDAKSAADLLLSIVADFPFATVNNKAADGAVTKVECYKTAWLACLLTPLARFAFEGPTPLTLFEANTPGVGKTLLAELIHLILFGCNPAACSSSANDEEMRKVITTQLRSGARMVVFDNVTGDFGCPALDMLLTSNVWSDRLLGTNDEICLPNTTTWVATANNVAISGDLYRRVLRCRMDSKLEFPEDREDFKIVDIVKHTLSIRGELLSAALTMLRAYYVAGKPDMKLKRWGKYEAWSAVVRSAIVWAELADPNYSRLELRKSTDSDVTALASVLMSLKGKGRLSTEDIVRLANEKSNVALREGLVRLGVRFDVPRSCGMVIRRYKERVCNGLALRSYLGHARQTFWEVVEMIHRNTGECGDVGDTGE